MEVKLGVLKKREEQRLEAAQMKFLKHLFGITKVDKEKNQCIRQKAVLASYNAAPHNRYQPHPAEPEQYTKCSNGFFVLLKMA